MPRKSKQNRRKRRNRKRRIPRPAQSGFRSPLKAYAEMVSNPCTAILKPGFHGSSKGYLAKVKNTSSISGLGAGVSAGYVLWVPILSSNGNPKPSQDEKESTSLTRGYNILAFTTEGGADSPVNTTLEPAFSSPVYINGGTGSFLPDPAAQLINSSTAEAGLMQDMRTISACMRVTYTGRMDRSSGLLAFVERRISQCTIGQTSF